MTPIDINEFLRMPSLTISGSMRDICILCKLSFYVSLDQLAAPSRLSREMYLNMRLFLNYYRLINLIYVLPPQKNNNEVLQRSLTKIFKSYRLWLQVLYASVSAS